MPAVGSRRGYPKGSSGASVRAYVDTLENMSDIPKLVPPMNRRRADALAEITPDRLAWRINALPLWARDYKRDNW